MIVKRERNKLKYRSEISGLRAIAIMSVIVFHADLGCLPGGFLGVDIFFVISGYLITYTMLAEMNSNEFTFVKFYERRARRILPALFVVLISCIPFGLMWMLPLQLRDFADSLVAINLLSSNVLFFLKANYFDQSSALKPLLHTWSLSVEEQIYLFLPIFLYIFSKKRRL
jgi:peptidoglycan/LPS O-acetylase OafA/YrhL